MAYNINDEAFRLLVESVVDYAIFMLDPKGRVTSWNPGAERIKQYSADEIVGKHFSAFYTDEDRKAALPKRVLETARKEGKFEGEGWRVRKDGSRFWASVVVDAMRNSKGELIGFAKVTRDMTENRVAQRRLEDAREQLFRSQKMEALGQLTGGLAHDFNNLLTAILGATDLASRNLRDPEKVQRMLDGIRNSAQRGAGLTKQLLAFARAQPLQIQQIELPGLLAETTTLLRPSLRSHIELIIETSDRLWPIDADAGALELALLNLAFNARDAMPGGGKLKISATNERLEGEPDGLRGEHVALRVVDTGTGMNSETMERVFEPFFTTKGFGEGTGLGLSQVFGFTKQLGGTVTVESEVGKGSIFTLYLPASRSPASRRRSGERQALARARACRRGRRSGCGACGGPAQRARLREPRRAQRQGSARSPGERRQAQGDLHGRGHARRNQRHRARATSARPLSRAADPPDHRLQRTGHWQPRLSSAAEALRAGIARGCAWQRAEAATQPGKLGTDD